MQSGPRRQGFGNGKERGGRPGLLCRFQECLVHESLAETSWPNRELATQLTPGADIVIVNRFREYPDRAVRETRRAAGWRKAHADWKDGLSGASKHCAILDTRDSPQDIPDR